jgi:hypothetical protein
LGSTGICDPNEYCYANKVNDALICYEITCDDISGDWIWYGKNESDANSTVWATVEITQENCQAELKVTTVDGGEAATHYASLWWREVWAMRLFDSVDARKEHDFFVGSVDGFETLIETLSAFSQDSDKRPADQCEYVGNFAAASDTNGTLARDVDGTYAVGDVVEKAIGCPEGYPRGFGDTDMPTSSPTEATEATSGAFHHASFLVIALVVVGVVEAAVGLL